MSLPKDLSQQRAKLFSLLLLSATSQTVFAVQDKSPWSFNTRATLGGDDNLTLAQRNRDIAEDNFVELAGSVAFSRLLSIRRGYTLAAFSSFQHHEKFDVLDMAKIGVSAIYRFQPELGFTAPFYKISATLKAEELNFDQRDSTVYELKFSAKKRITDKLAMSLGLAHQGRDSDGTVFDLERNRVFLNADLRIGHKGTLYSNYSYIDGDTTSTVFLGAWQDQGAQVFKVINAATATETDQAFTSALPGSWQAYKIEAKTQTVSLGYNHSLSSSMALDISGIFADVKTQGDGEYQRLITRLSLLVRF